LDFTKTIIPLALIASESKARARGIIVNYSTAKHAKNAVCLSHLPIHSDRLNEGVDEVRLINLLQIESLAASECRSSSGGDTNRSDLIESTTIRDDSKWGG